MDFVLNDKGELMTETQKYKNPETILLHAAFRHDKDTNSVAVPIYPSTAFVFDSLDKAADMFALKAEGNIYARLSNPTSDILEKRMAEFEGGSAALSVSSGQSASLLAVLNLCSCGDNFVASKDLYGGTFNLFFHTLKNMGIEVRFADPDDLDTFRKATDDRTRCYFAETTPNPRINVFPISDAAAIAKEYGIPLIIDNTCTPMLCRPFDHGADIIVYSATKYIGGHGNSLGGIIIEKGDFPWRRYASRFPSMTEPDESYHGQVWCDMGNMAFIMRTRLVLMRDLGCAMSPFNAWLMIQGLETLPLRMRAHSENAAKVAAFLSHHDKVNKVIYPSIAVGKQKEISEKHLKGGFGGLMAFELKGGLEAGKKFMQALKLFYHVTNLGDTRSLATHPATTTHAQLSDEAKLATGITDGYIRLAIGIEHIDDIIADLKQALDKV